ncbi:hypothetical protein BGW80DRAFT_147270 [Lactifluus volemus]|nr:hypothetical protein BGW80DRAFT_147270 [Lactifluus volemus]
MAVILDIVELDVYTPINCQIVFELIFSYFGLACASLLLMLRVFAIWKRNKIILALSTTVWITNVAFLIQGVVRIRSVWIPEERSCRLSNSDTAKLNAISTLATDTMLLLMMLAGLLHLRLQGGGMLSLGDFLWKQGLIWFLLAAVAEVPPMIPALIVLTIAATRMYRSLINFSSEMADGVPSSGRSFPRVNVLSRVIPLTPILILTSALMSSCTSMLGDWNQKEACGKDC